MRSQYHLISWWGWVGEREEIAGDPDRVRGDHEDEGERGNKGEAERMRDRKEGKG